jgi:hypothetical protein
MALKNTGYQVAIQSIAWAAGQSLASLTDNEWTDLSDEIDNSTNKYVTMDIAIDLGSAAFTGTDSIIEVYVVPSVDGTNFGMWTGNVTTDEQENVQYFVGSVTTSGATEAQTDLTLRNVVVPPGKYKFGFRNRSNVTLNATNAAGYRPHSFEDA